MEYTTKAIKTKYKGRTYRSRLEARWACMFDLLGWRYEYEPYDLPGYIPDFALFEGDKEYVCEVKPFGRREDWEPVIDRIVKALEGTCKEGLDILLLGCSLLPYTAPECRGMGGGYLGCSYYVIRELSCRKQGRLTGLPELEKRVAYEGELAEGDVRETFEAHLTEKCPHWLGDGRWDGTRHEGDLYYVLYGTCSSPEAYCACNSRCTVRGALVYTDTRCSAEERDGVWTLCPNDGGPWYDETLELWNEAGNKVQWQPR